MFRDPQRLVQSQAGPAGNQVLQRLRDKPFWLVNGVRKPMFDYERMLYKALLEPGHLNRTPSLHSDDPPSLNVCQSIPRACLQKYKSLGKYSCHVRARNTNTLREIWVLILLSS